MQGFMGLRERKLRRDLVSFLAKFVCFLKIVVFRQFGGFFHNFLRENNISNCSIKAQAAQSYPVLLITLYLYINSILKIIRKSCVINLLRYIFIYNSIMKSTYMCFLKDFNENRPRLALILRLTAIVLPCDINYVISLYK